jgi:hypothetical protein
MLYRRAVPRSPWGPVITTEHMSKSMLASLACSGPDELDANITKYLEESEKENVNEVRPTSFSSIDLSLNSTEHQLIGLRGCILSKINGTRERQATRSAHLIWNLTMNVVCLWLSGLHGVWIAPVFAYLYIFGDFHERKSSWLHI